MHLYKVGELYRPDRTAWPEGIEYNFRNGSHELILRFGSPSKHEIEQVRVGDARFSLLVRQPVIMLVHRFGNLPWCDSSYTIHLVPPEERQLPEPITSLECRAALNIVLINADNGIIEVLRLVSLSPKFTADLHDAIRVQSESPWDKTAYLAAIDKLYQVYPEASDMARASIRTCIGGE